MLIDLWLSISVFLLVLIEQSIQAQSYFYDDNNKIEHNGSMGHKWEP